MIWKVDSIKRAVRRRNIDIFLLFVSSIFLYRILKFVVVEGPNVGSLIFMFCMIGFVFLVLFYFRKYSLKEINKPSPLIIEVDIHNNFINLEIDSIKGIRSKQIAFSDFAFKENLIKEVKLLTFYEIKRGTRGQPLYMELCQVLGGRHGKNNSWSNYDIGEIVEVMKNNSIKQRFD